LLRNWVYPFLGNTSCRLLLVCLLSSWGESFSFVFLLPSLFILLPSTLFLPSSTVCHLRDSWTSLHALDVGSTPYPSLLVPLFSRYLSFIRSPASSSSLALTWPLCLSSGSHTRFAHVRASLTTSIGPAFAIPAVLTKAGISKDDVDFYEINEAFASQAVMSIQHLHLPYEKVSILLSRISCR
jgi:hypothetical protein